MNFKIAFNLIILVLLLVGCRGVETTFSSNKYAFSKSDAAGTINASFLNLGGNNKTSLSAHFFDASKRVGISVLDIKETSKGNYTFRPRYLAEEQPDIAFEIGQSFFADANFKQTEQINARLQLATNYLSAVKSLTKKSYTLSLMRSLAYRLGEGAFNGDLDDKDYDTVFCELIRTAEDLQKEEFKMQETISKNQADAYKQLNLLLSQIDKKGLDSEIAEMIILNFISSNQGNDTSLEDIQKKLDDLKSKNPIQEDGEIHKTDSKPEGEKDKKKDDEKEK